MEKYKHFSKISICCVLLILFDLSDMTLSSCMYSHNLVYRCESENVAHLTTTLTTVMDEHKELVGPIDLSLSDLYYQSEEYPNLILKLPHDWFGAHTAVKSLEFIKVRMHGIEDGAFNLPQLVRLIELKIETFPLMVITDKTFIGIPNLQKLTLVKVQVFQIDANALKPVSLLTQFEMVCNGDELEIDNLFGTAVMKQLEKVKIEKCNLGRSISKSTFVGLKAVNTLSLASNKITLIGEGSFVAISPTIAILDLRMNELKSLPRDLFQDFGQSILMLKGNPWHCDCQLEYVRQFLLSSQSSLGSNRILCKTPIKYAAKSLIDCHDLCDAKLEEKKKLAPKTPETREGLNEIEVSNSIAQQEILIKPQIPVHNEILNELEGIEHKLNSGGNKNKPAFSIKNEEPENTVPSEQNNKRNPILECSAAIDRVAWVVSTFPPAPVGLNNMELVLMEKVSNAGKPLKNLNFIGFQQNKTDFMNCLKLPKFGQTGRVKLAEILPRDRTYRFCSMEKGPVEKGSKLTTLMNCIIFHSPKKIVSLEDCVLMEEKPKIITAFIVSAIFAPFVGILLACALVKYCIHRNRKRRNNFRIDNQVQCETTVKTMMNPVRRRFVSTVLRRPISQAMQGGVFKNYEENDYGYITVTDSPPPLPPRQHVTIVEASEQQEYAI